MTRSLGALALAVLAACGETTASAALGAARVTALSASGLTGVAGTALADRIEFRVLDAGNQPLAGVSVTFGASGSGAVDPASATTDASGVARTRWTLSRTIGANTLTASAGANVSTSVTATGSAGRAATVTAVGGITQTASVGSPVPIVPAVRVVDAFGNLVEGVAVTFTVLTGGGTTTGAVARTSSQGVAAVGSWVLGQTAGNHTLTARVEEGGVANNPIVFTAIATPGAAAAVAAASAVAQVAPAGTAVAAPPSIKVTDAGGNPVPNVAVNFTVTAGGGTVSPQALLTNTQGVATASSWLLGTTAGPNQVTATAGTLPPVIFQATGAAGAAATMTLVTGNNQSAQAGRPLAIAPSVVIQDANGNPLPGIIVTFSVTSGGGTAVGARQTTDATGTAEVGAWFLGTAPGTNTMTASSTGLPAVTFTATGLAGAAVSMVANAPLVQSATAGSAVATPPSVIVRDLAGNPVPGIQVTFGVTAGGGAVVGSPATTNASGVATLTSWTLGTAVGTNLVVANAAGLPSVTFTATGTAGPAANVVIVSGNNQAGIAGSPVATPPKVRVTDAAGNAVSGATVTFAVTGGSGTVSGATQTTDAAGEAAVGSWTLGSGSPNTLSATVTGSGITGNPLTFTADAATAIVITGPPTSPQTLGTNFSFTVELRNSAGGTVSLAGVPLTVAIATGGGTLNGVTTVNTLSTGAVTFTVNVTGVAGARTFNITGSGLTTATTGSITIN
ncbi:MAG: Ig-like domain-containing protein [Gemmatimonadetes bacterium]|nr:Ig-like domain-containing protein [Gemmatimonadota bacterium]